MESRRGKTLHADRRQFLRNSVRAGGLLAAKTILGELCLPDAHAAQALTPLVSPKTSKVVDTTSGKIRGLMNEDVSAFKGIPYAGPTEGVGRFMPPTPVTPWVGVHNTQAFGPHCYPIKANLFNAWAESTSPSENCLVLNVWTPAPDGNKRPVMVYMHGGGFFTGSGGEVPYEGTHLAKKGDVVVVTVNHRLNIFGYMYLGGMSDKYAVGNVGQLDLVAALTWVQANIALFGGDPKNVTIFGQSGGGGKVNTLMAMPSAKGLFGKAINQSGANLRGNTREEGNSVADAVLTELGLKQNQVNDLLKIPAARLVEVAATIMNRHDPALNANPFQPVVDGSTLFTQPWDPIAPELSADVPLMIGSTSGEAAALIGNDIKDPPKNDTELRGRLTRALKSRVSISDAEITSLIALYRKGSPNAPPINLMVSILTDTAQFRNATLQAERKIAQKRAPVFMYKFDWESPRLGGMWAYHCVDVPFVFDNLDIPFALDADNGDTTTNPQSRALADSENKRFALAEKTLAAWVAFARTGNPSNSKTGSWPAYTLDRRATMIFDKECGVVDDPRSEFRVRVTSLPT